ncbi:alpha/beta hydrolase [Sphingobacterium bambusae]|uniref:Alpha/beta hydrolase n=1 Tax=Sphingobacterium bambusae TaxID=662858 RepID=A0ABW6BHR8_9SPHI|nr:alpha/beta hydrolase-fold protein [Sphingobacterium bambusae]WPL49048.1 alpha/beta hydrolase-fold protein [Sphingobacterium bambusae]
MALQHPCSLLAILCLTFAFIACNTDKRNGDAEPLLNHQFSIYANEIRDSFQVSVQLPEEYNADSSKQHYPMVLLTDADLYFPMLAPVVRQYERIGLLPPIVLVGIGYGSIPKMDSLRVRDFLYPKAITSDEMEAPGGGLKFYDFICEQLIPTISQNYRLAEERLLLGHSFGANFSLLAMQTQQKSEEQTFHGFVAASPAIWYNDFYFLKQAVSLPPTKSISKLFLTIGSKEDKQWTIEPVKQYAAAIGKMQTDSMALSVFQYPEMTHMETGLVSMLQGIVAHFGNADEY